MTRISTSSKYDAYLNVCPMENKLTDRWFSKTLLLVYCLTGTNPALTAATHPAEQTVEQFYNAVADKRCPDAITLRLGYTLEQCKRVSNAYLHRVELQRSDQKNAVVLLEADIEINKKNQYFIGYTYLQYIKKRWFIIGPYQSLKNYTLNEYIQAFVPEGIQTRKESPEHPGTARKTLKHHRVLPPAEPIDATPPLVQKQAVILTSGPPDLASEKPSAPAPLTLHPDEDTAELTAYMKGNIAIEGNFIQLLSDIQRLFTSPPPATMLVDQSQRILYFYQGKNILAGFYPVMTPNIFSFPGGLYRIYKQPHPVENPGRNSINTIQKPIDNLDSESITLEKLILDKENKLWVGGYFYLRNFFDSDQKNSLSLSPVDLKNLHQLIDSSVLVYIAK